MTEATSFDDIPEREPLPTSAAGGTGITPDLKKMKAADLLNRDIGVLGFLVIPNRYKENDHDPDEVLIYEVMDAEGERWAFTHGSRVLRRIAEERQEREELPFRTRLILAESAKGRKYYTFA